MREKKTEIGLEGFIRKYKKNYLMVFSFLPKNMHFIQKKKKKMQFCVCFLKMFHPLKG